MGEEKNLKIAICDDNSQDLYYFADVFKRLADDHKEDVEIVTYPSGKQLLFDSDDTDNPADIVFLDVNMPEISGIEVAEKLRTLDYKGEIIFLTVSTTHYSDAFDLHALHYIVKRVTPPDKIEDIFMRAIRTARKKSEEYIRFSSAGEFRNIAVKSLRYFETLNKIVTVHYGKDERFSFYCASLKKIEDQLYGKELVRIHRSYLVAESQIIKVTYNHIFLLDGQMLPVGRKYYPRLREIMPDK